jgi:DNA replication protein DnaC
MKKNTAKDNIKNLAKELKLPYTSKNIEEDIKEANIRNLTYEDFLLSILENEHDLRKSNGIKSRIRQARFPYIKYIEDLSLEDLPQDARDKVKVFSSLDFIETGQNIILAGNPGTGNYRKFYVIERNERLVMKNHQTVL